MLVNDQKKQKTVMRAKRIATEDAPPFPRPDLPRRASDVAKSSAPSTESENDDESTDSRFWSDIESTGSYLTDSSSSESDDKVERDGSHARRRRRRTHRWYDAAGEDIESDAANEKTAAAAAAPSTTTTPTTPLLRRIHNALAAGEVLLEQKRAAEDALAKREAQIVAAQSDAANEFVTLRAQLEADTAKAQLRVQRTTAAALAEQHAAQKSCNALAAELIEVREEKQLLHEHIETQLAVAAEQQDEAIKRLEKMHRAAMENEQSSRILEHDKAHDALSAKLAECRVEQQRVREEHDAALADALAEREEAVGAGAVALKASHAQQLAVTEEAHAASTEELERQLAAQFAAKSEQLQSAHAAAHAALLATIAEQRRTEGVMRTKHAEYESAHLAASNLLVKSREAEEVLLIQSAAQKKLHAATVASHSVELKRRDVRDYTLAILFLCFSFCLNDM